MNRIGFHIGTLPIGNGASISIQSMSDIKTEHVKENIDLTNRLSEIGLEMMRFSVLDEKDAQALQKIKQGVSVPVVADIHYNLKLAFLALESGVDKIRVNPGNYNSEALLRDLIHSCKEKGVAIRIGVNGGSLERYRQKAQSESEAFLLALEETVAFFREECFDHLVLSVKSTNPMKTRELSRLAYSHYPYPLHIGLTESGTPLVGSIRSTYALTSLLEEGIGDTIRISLQGNRKEEIRACKELLSLTGRRKDIPTLIACPGCGRTMIDLSGVAEEVQTMLDHIRKPCKVAVMGCPVNGIGEAKDADCGIAGSGKENCYLYFEHGHEKGLYSKDEALQRIREFLSD